MIQAVFLVMDMDLSSAQSEMDFIKSIIIFII